VAQGISNGQAASLWTSAMVTPFSLFRFLLRDARAQTETVYPWQLPSIMRKHIITGAMGMLFFALLSGMYLVSFGSHLGIPYWQWGVLSAASSFVFLLQLPSAYLVSRTGNRRTLWYATSLISRLVRGFAIATAFVLAGFSGQAARTVFILLLVVANCFDAIANPPWFSWLADIIPEREQGRFWGRRAAWINLANAIVLMPIGFAMDRVRQDYKLSGLLTVFAFGFVIGILDLVIHRTIPEPPMPMPPRNPFWREVKAPLSDSRFRPWLVFDGLWTFGMALGGSLAMVYFVENLGIKHDYTGGTLVLIVIPLLATVLTAQWMGILVDEKGVKRMMFWGYALWATIPAFWILAGNAGSLTWLAVGGVLGTVGAQGAMTAVNKLITRLPPSSGHVSMYFAVTTCVEAVTGALGALSAGVLLHALKNWSWQVGGITVIGFHVLFAASFVLRGLSLLAISPIPEPGRLARVPSPQGARPPAPTS
jgi:MFS family permease